MEEEIRKAAVRRYILQGESPKTIYISLNRSKKWFYKWLNRYYSQGKEWHKNKDFSRTPVNAQGERFRDKAASGKSSTLHITGANGCKSGKGGTPWVVEQNV
jgi:transposase